MLPHRIFLALILAASVLATGCIKDGARTLSELQVINNELTKKFGDPVHVHLGTGASLILTITFINSALNDKTPADRSKRAEATAQLIKAHYQRIQSVKEIWVVFVRQKTHLIVFHSSNAFEVYGFDKDAQALRRESDLPGLVTPRGPGEAPPLSKRLTHASYNPNRNETEISIGAVQLKGAPGFGLTVLPHFKLLGDATTKQASPPKEVSFDFASYSKSEHFGETVPVAFIADGKPVLRTSATFFGNEAEFCYLTVPYAAFRKMVVAKTMTIKLGENDYRFPPNDFLALQQMAEHVKE